MFKIFSRRASIQTQLVLITGLLILLSSIIAAIGYLSLRSYQSVVETRITEANTIRQLSLKIQSEFLLARQAEADLASASRAVGFATLTAAATSNRRHVENATLALNQMEQLTRAAHDPELRALQEEIDKLRPQLYTYNQAFRVVITALEQRSGAGGSEEEAITILQQMEASLITLHHTEWHRLLLQIRASKQNYLYTNQREYMEEAYTLTGDLITLLENSTSADLTTTDGQLLDKAELIRQASRLQQVLDKILSLDRDIGINRAIFEGITQRINQITAEIGDQSSAGLNRAHAQLDATRRSSTLAIGLTAAIAIGVGVLIAAGWSRRIIQPLNQLAQAAQQIGRGNMQTVTVIGSQELEALAHAFNTMVDQVRQTLSGLEQQVAARTRDLERRAAQIATGAEIAHVATTLLDPDELIASVVNLIQQRFDLYYVGLFLLDAEGRYAVLHAGTGEAGRIMKERGHRLEVGGQSMIGWVCANKQARIALDVGKDAVRFANPYLPDTHSELALPMRAGNRIIGALSIQSTQTAAFDEGDIAALQGMADQIAVALENARLFQQTQETLQKLDEANRLLTRQGWQEYLTAAPQAPYAEFYAPGGTVTASGSLPHILRIPLEAGGQPLGTLIMERSAHTPGWTDEEAETIRAIAQQATLALDNARLFEESQRLAAREHLIGEITGRIRSAATLEGVLNAAVREVSLLTGASYAAIDLELVESAHQSA